MYNKKNSGLTLIELIVVIAIMAVLTGSMAVSMTLISRQKVANAASSTKSMLQLAQTYTKSKEECRVTIEGTTEGDSNLYIYVFDGSKWKLGNGPQNINKKIKTIVEFDDDDKTKVPVGAGDVVNILFDRTTGGFTEVEIPGGGGDKATPVKITFTNGTKSSSLVLAKYTGVISFEAQNK